MPGSDRYIVGVDIGGTFTDFAMLDGDQVVLEKTLSTPEDRSLAVMEGLERLARRQGLDLTGFLGRVEAIIHGTTIADNDVLRAR